MKPFSLPFPFYLKQNQLIILSMYHGLGFNFFFFGQMFISRAIWGMFQMGQLTLDLQLCCQSRADSQQKSPNWLSVNHFYAQSFLSNSFHSSNTASLQQPPHTLEV